MAKNLSTNSQLKRDKKKERNGISDVIVNFNVTHRIVRVQHTAIALGKRNRES